MHQKRGHPVANDGVGNPEGAELPRGEARALEQGPGFIDVDVDAAPMFVRSANDAERRADTRGRKAAGVAMSQDVVAIRQKQFTTRPDGVAERGILLEDLLGGSHHRGGATVGIGPTGLEHSVDCGSEIDGRRPCVPERGGLVRQTRSPRALFGRPGQRHGRRDPQKGRAPNHQRTNEPRHFLRRAAFAPHRFVRQPPLVEHEDSPVYMPQCERIQVLHQELYSAKDLTFCPSPHRNWLRYVRSMSTAASCT